jgi:hypothetical protein
MNERKRNAALVTASRIASLRSNLEAAGSMVIASWPRPPVPSREVAFAWQAESNDRALDDAQRQRLMAMTGLVGKETLINRAKLAGLTQGSETLREEGGGLSRFELDQVLALSEVGRDILRERAKSNRRQVGIPGGW